jgi:hypothetical protein
MRSVDDLPLAKEVFETGKTRRNLWVVCCGGFLLLLGCASLLSPPGPHTTSANAVAGVAVGVALIAGGAALAVAALRSYRLSLVALFPEGFLFRNWRGRAVFIPWGKVVEVCIDRWGTGITDTLSQTARSVYVTAVAEDGSRSRIRLSTDDRDERAIRLASELARQASLQHRGLVRPSCEVWDRPAGDGRA